MAVLQHLKKLSPRQIFPNPENPRLIFRQDEMESLMLSISEYGIQVPVTVYEDNSKYFLIDGERRWRCASKLNLKEIPALVQEKPSELENLLLMSNIHALREQWDYFTIAINLERIITLFEEEHGEQPKEPELTGLTGLSRGAIRRCRLILALPEKYKELLLKELELPKSQQKITEDMLLEMERSLKTVTTRLPEFSEKLDKIRDVLIEKYKRGVISAVTDFRQLTKIATSIEGLGIAKKRAEKALEKIFDDNDINIIDIYKKTVEFQYDERRVPSKKWTPTG